MIIKKDNGVMLEKDDGLAGDKVTKEQLLESAKREFLEKGYKKDSLRTTLIEAAERQPVLYCTSNMKNREVL